MAVRRDAAARSDDPGERATRLGRPRANPDGYGGGEPREEILAAAARLFTTHGYRQASTKQIAEAVGLRQASLFYYFPKKEDILSELLDRTVQRSLDFVDWLAEADLPPAVGLYLLIYNDLQTLGGPPSNIGWLMFQPDARTDRFDDFWDKHTRLLNAYRDLVEDGLQAGVFTVNDTVLTARVLCGLVEGVSGWSGPPTKKPDAEVWTEVTCHAMRSVLAQPEMLEQIREDVRTAQAEF